MKTEVDTSVDENTNSRDDETSVTILDTMEIGSRYRVETFFAEEANYIQASCRASNL